MECGDNIKLRVLHVLNTGKYSGAENVAITIIKNMGAEVDAIYTSPDGPIKEVLQGENITFYPMFGARVTRRNLKRIIQETQPDIIHAHDFRAGVVSASLNTNIPIVNHLHNNTPWMKKICFKSIAYFLSTFRYRHILTVSDSVMDEFVFGKITAKKASVVGNPVDINAVITKANQDVLNEKSDIAFLGRLSEQKRPFLFLEIVNDIIKQFPDLRVAMIGDGEMREIVEEKIYQWRLENNVILYGFQKNPYNFLNNSKILCMPSAWEGFGLAAVEALALGKPVVASPVGGLVNIINDRCGKLCESKEDFVTEIRYLLSDKNLYRIKSEGAVRRAKKFNNVEQYCSALMCVYRQYLGRN